MKNKDIVKEIEAIAPIETAEDYDNVGLLIGSLEDECKGVIIALDLTVEVAKEAVEKGCNLVITHHPIIFHSINRINTDEAQGEIIKILMSNNISCYAAHTNLDKSKFGIGSKLAEQMDAKEIVNDGVGTIFTMDTMSLEMFARKIAKKLADKSVKAVGNPDAQISKVYVVSGGGGGDIDLLTRAKEVADVFVSGDMKHHVYIEAANSKFPLIEFSHYSSEIVAVDIFYNLIKPIAKDIKVVKARQECPYKLLEEL